MCFHDLVSEQISEIFRVMMCLIPKRRVQAFWGQRSHRISLLLNHILLDAVHLLLAASSRAHLLLLRCILKHNRTWNTSLGDLTFLKLSWLHLRCRRWVLPLLVLCKTSCLIQLPIRLYLLTNRWFLDALRLVIKLSDLVLQIVLLWANLFDWLRLVDHREPLC